MNWEFTGNHYLAWPCIDPADGAIHEVNVVHRGMASLVSWTGQLEGPPDRRPLLRICLSIDGRPVTLDQLRWERLDRWIPRFTMRAPDGSRVTVTYCAPGGFDPLAAGGTVSVQVENGGQDAPVRVWLEGNWAWVLRTMATSRPMRGSRSLCFTRPGTLALEAGEIPAGVALAISTDGPDAFTEWARGEDATAAGAVGAELEAPNGEGVRFRVGSERVVPAGRRALFTFAFGVAQERDGASAVASRLGTLGADELVRRGRLDLASLNRATDESVARDLIARNLIFHHYWAAARAVDDDRVYPVMSRSRAHGECAVYGEREALAWSLPAYALTDSLVARELLMRVLEMQSDRPGNHRRYIDGGLLDAGFSLGRACDYVIAIERYVELARDGAFADEPLVQQIFREVEELAWSRLHDGVFLGSTEILSAGQRADYPYCAFDNVLLWKLCSVLDRFRRTEPGEPRPRLAGGHEEIEAAFWQRFGTDVDGLPVIAYEVDLKGHAAIYDDPMGSLRLLPSIGFCSADDPIWTNTMELLHSRAYPLFLGGRRFPGFAGRSRPDVARFSALCADLLTSRRDAALEQLRALDLPGGVACIGWDPDSGKAVLGPYAASEAGFLVWAMLAGANDTG